TSAAITWRDLAAGTGKRAELLRREGLRAGDVVAVALPPGIDHVVATLALWEIGAVVVPVDHRWTDAAKADVVERFPRGWVIEGSDPAPVSYHGRAEPIEGLADLTTDGLPRSVSLSGGTTGVPKLLVRNRPWAYPESGPLGGRERERGMAYGQTQIVGLPLYHAGFGALYHGLALGHRIIVPGNASP
ncbi:AMP-binding protein, partial [Nocardia gipuzkoensis]